jgi:hypothetical protein
MSTLKSIVQKSVSLGNLQRVHGLGVIPILTEEVPELPILESLEAGLSKGSIRIGETSESGEVPFLLLENTGDLPVILLDGEEVVGGKQNRIINTTLVVPAHTTVKIPVSCIQAGRWRKDRADFESGQSIFRAKSRAVQKSTVTASVRARGSYRSDQHAVFDQVRESLRAWGVRSETSDFTEGRERVAHRIEEFVEAIRPAESQIGAIFINSEGILGLEMLGTPILFSLVYQKVTRSFAFEVFGGPDMNGVSVDGAREWWEKILQSEFSRHAPPAAGEDIRMGTHDLIGSGLVWNGVLVHFSCFPNVGREDHRPNR